MPQINRVRIINFSYNGDKRQIMDESFNFHGGENALLNLKNGGGKSVLVQVLMQPILPNETLQTRKMKEFFVKKKLPSYILIEWKLDEQGGYLLTGIAMTNKESSGVENEETENSLKYFTFTSSYRMADAMDIMNIPLIRKEGKRLIIKTYKEAQELILSESRARGSHVGYFTHDDKRHYTDTLLSYNISQDEWRTVIKPINSDEGGVINIFEKCKTSRQLMREWILKTVDKVVIEDKKKTRSLDEMLENLAEAMIENEQFILERNLLTDFLDKIEVYGEQVSEFYTNFTKKQEVLQRLLSLTKYLNEEIMRQKGKIEASEEKLIELKGKLRRIDIEEKSKDYHDVQDQYLMENVCLEEIQRKVIQTKKNHELKFKELQLIQAAGFMEKIRKFQTRLSGVEESLKRLESDEDDKAIIEKLNYSLKCIFEEKIGETQNLVSRLDDELEKLIRESQDIRLSINTKENRLAVLRKKETELISNMRIFETNEKELFDRIGLVVGRDLTGKLSEEEALKTNRNLDLILKKNKDELLMMNNSLNKNEDHQKNIREERQEIGLKKQVLNEKIKAKKFELERYLQEEEELKTILKNYEIDFTKRFLPEVMSLEIKSRIEEYTSILDQFKEEERSLNKRKKAMENGTLHVSEEYRDFLVKNDVQFNTGENYLQKLPYEKREELLSGQPLLPYAFLLTPEELEKVKYRRPDTPILQPVTIITLNSLDSRRDGSDYLVEFGSGTKVLCLYDKNLFNSDGFESYKDTIEESLDKAREKLSHYKEVLDEARRHQNLISVFRYSSTWLSSIEKDVQSLGNEWDCLTEREFKSNEDEKSIEIMMISLKKQMKKVEKNVDDYDKHLYDFLKYLEGNSIYEIWNDEKKDITTELLQSSKQIEAYRNRGDFLKDTQNQTNHEANKQKMQLNDLELEAAEYSHAIIAEIQEGSLEELKERLSVYRRDTENTLKDLNEQKKDAIREIASIQEDVDDLHQKEEDYRLLPYSNEKKRSLSLENEALFKEVTISKEEERVMELKVNKLQTMAGEKLKRVEELVHAPLPKVEIFSDFERRKTECTIEAGKLMKENEEIKNQINKNENLINRVLRLIPEEEIPKEYHGLPFNENLEEEYIVLKETITNLNKLVLQEEKAIKNYLMKLQSDYKEKNNNVSIILDGLEKQAQQANQNNEKYYYLYEYAMNQRVQLQNLIKVNQSRLEKMEMSFHDAVMQSYMHAVNLHEQIKKVAEDSGIHLSGKTRPVKMIEIDLPEPEDKAKSMEKMQKYIKARAIDVETALKDGKKREEVRKVIASFMSSEELLNVISDLSRLKIKAYKIDINIKNSQAKEWEKVMKENSGGERFVSFFAVLVALMSYSRTSSKAVDDYSRNKDTKVLLMDNPFGPISSEHLLQPLFEIAKKYNTQLICLTDLKQNSIMNCFNLIYMLKIIPNTLGTMEYLKLEEEYKVENGTSEDESLEKIVYRASDYEQLNLLAMADEEK